MVKEILQKGRDLTPRFSVFSLAPIPLVIHLGFLLSDRVEVRYFQYDRENATWKWRVPKKAQADCDIRVAGIPGADMNEEAEVSIAVSLSAKISAADIRAAAPNASVNIEIFVENPNVLWLQSAEQVKKLGQVFRGVLSAIGAKIPACRKIHLFYAEPTGGCVVVGKQINPRMNPPIELYEFSYQTNPRYKHALTLTADLS